MLLELPVEIISQITKWCCKETKKILRSVHPRLAYIIGFQLFHTIYFGRTNYVRSREKEMVRFIHSAVGRTLAPYVKMLDVFCDGKKYDHESLAHILGELNQLEVCQIESRIGNNLQVIHSLSEHIYELTKERNIAIHIDCRFHNDNWQLWALTDNHIQSMVLRASKQQSFVLDDHRALSSSIFARILSTSPILTKLTITIKDNPPHLLSILTEHEGDGHLMLKELEIPTVMLELLSSAEEEEEDKQRWTDSLCKIPLLKRLVLTDFSASEYVRSSQSPRISSGFWQGLLDVGIYLAAIWTTHINQELISYLSHPRMAEQLEYIRIDNIEVNPEPDSEQKLLSQSFWTIVVPNVASTLRELLIFDFHSWIPINWSVLETWALSPRTMPFMNRLQRLHCHIKIESISAGPPVEIYPSFEEIMKKIGEKPMLKILTLKLLHMSVSDESFTIPWESEMRSQIMNWKMTDGVNISLNTGLFIKTCMVDTKNDVFERSYDFILQSGGQWKELGWR